MGSVEEVVEVEGISALACWVVCSERNAIKAMLTRAEYLAGCMRATVNIPVIPTWGRNAARRAADETGTTMSDNIRAKRSKDVPALR